MLVELAQFAPASVLARLGWVWVFFTFEPETEPVEVALIYPPFVSRRALHMSFLRVFKPFDWRTRAT